MDDESTDLSHMTSRNWLEIYRDFAAEWGEPGGLPEPLADCYQSGVQDEDGTPVEYLRELAACVARTMYYSQVVPYGDGARLIHCLGVSLLLVRGQTPACLLEGE